MFAFLLIVQIAHRRVAGRRDPDAALGRRRPRRRRQLVGIHDRARRGGFPDPLDRRSSAALFIVLSIVMAAIAGATREPTKIDTSLAGKTAPAQQPQPVQPAPARAGNAPQNQQAPAVPLAQ